MKENQDLARIVRQAQEGREGSLDVLATHVRPRVMLYLYRMTLDYHLAQDLTQETMVTLIESLQFLKTDSHSSLWAWIYRTAMGKGQHHFRRQGRRQQKGAMTVDHEVLDRLPARPAPDGFEHAQRQELIEAMSRALETLKVTYRQVLVLRCFEQLSFAEIASVLGSGTELGMRLLFLRAKRALARQLRHRGFGHPYFLSGLTLFATVTALQTKSKAAAPAATAELVQAGTLATVLGTLTAPVGLAIVAGVALTLVAAPVFIPQASGPIPTVREAIALRPFSSIGRTFAPQGGNWERLIPFDNRPSQRVPLDVNTLVDDPSVNSFLILPDKHWIEFGFAGPFVDGPGPDIEYHCLTTDRLPTVFLSDGGTQPYQLPNGDHELRQGWAHRVQFDLAQCQCPFTPTALRIEGVGPPTQPESVTLVNLKARVIPGADKASPEDD